MSESSKAYSTAERLHHLQRRRLNTVLFFINLGLLALVVSIWCYVQDSAYTGVSNPFRLLNMVERGLSVVWPFAPGPYELTYHIYTRGQEALSIDATHFSIILGLGLVITILLEGIVKGLANFFSLGQIRKQLQPLYQLIDTAEEFAAQAPQDVLDSKLMHKLEQAIDNTTPDQQLHMGDADLSGLENAINSLISRTKAGYEQQSRFVSDASHELRTPISVIKGYADLLERWGRDDPKILDESIIAIKAEADHMNVLVEQLLFLARGESGRIKLELVNFSLSALVREIYEESVMIDAQHEWQLDVEEEIIAYGDPAMLKQAARILVDNAAKYSPPGELITLRARRDKNNYPALVVQDNGIGMQNEQLSHIFERFYRADPSRDRQQGGSGLGLSIAKWIVDCNSGYFDIVSAPEIGTRISMHLPPAQGGLS